jgi:hypothetical protein
MFNVDSFDIRTLCGGVRRHRGPGPLPLLFFASAIWVAACEAEIFPAVCNVHRGAATLDGALRDVAGASLSLPTIESETYSSTGGGGTTYTSTTSQTL